MLIYNNQYDGQKCRRVNGNQYKVIHSLQYAFTAPFLNHRLKYTICDFGKIHYNQKYSYVTNKILTDTQKDPPTKNKQNINAKNYKN